MKASYQKLGLPCNLTDVIFQNDKTVAYSKVNSGIMHILCMVIPTKVDTSQVSQQNVNWMSAVKTQISTPAIQKTHLYRHY